MTRIVGIWIVIGVLLALAIVTLVIARRKNSTLKKNKSLWRNILLFGILFLGGVFLWRGAWNLLDAYLLPSTPFLSSMISLAIGALIVSLAIALAPPASGNAA